MAVSSEADDFLHGGNAVFIAELYEQYLRDPGSVDESWTGFFAGLKSNGHADEAPGAAPWGRMRARVIANGHDAAPAPNGAAHAAPEEGGRQATLDSIRALMLIRAYRVRGHLYARLDPLGLHEPEHHPELDPATYGFGEDDWDRPIFIDGVLGRERASMREIMAAVHDIYCSSIGVEFMHIQDPDQKAWIQKRIERPLNRTEFTERGRRAILERLTEAEVFEHFLDRKYIGTKRFGLEGGEALIPALEQIIKRGGEIGLEEAVVGMAHRGRLNVLANFMGKPFQAILSEFQGQPANPEDVQGSGDVKYHLGTSSDREFDGNVIHLSLCPNPSHLEIVNPVVIGRARAKQEQRGDHDRDKVMPILLHGDAAFIGQGLVAETFELSELRGYRVGGTIHIVINNQIGFTTSPTDSRSSPYCSGMAQIVQAPVFHVNGDDPEAVVHVARIATEFRFRFKCDVVIDMYCYRRQGHNEADEPAFTQPLMYDAIDKHATTRAIYADRLVAEGLLSREEADGIVESIREQLEHDFEAAKSYKPNKADWLEGAWTGIEIAREGDRRGTTAVPLEQLKAVGSRLATVPDGFDLNPKIARQFRQRARVFETGEGLDWANAEALALGTLAAEGVAVRLSGQDCGRGTFSQRHAMLRDQTDESKYIPLQHVGPDQGRVEIIDSPLAEASVLGFEYGYSQSEPHALVMWEAQFGDFANGAQVVMDQFISSGESKWLRMSGLVMLLPHGYEGQGPEHSSARLERYLQLCAEDNMQVIYPTTPANYFHALRRQVRRDIRKPLIVMTPKSLLRHRLCVSGLDELAEGSSFHRVMPEIDEVAASESVRRVVLCTGKVYYDLLQQRREESISDVALLRVEQLYPFPAQTLADELARYPNAGIVWCQEEPANMGAWTFVDRRIEEVLEDVGSKARRPRYVGRHAAASPATGLLKRHNFEQKALVAEALAAD